MATPTLRAKSGTFKDRAKGLGGEVDFFGAKWAAKMDGFLEGVRDHGHDVVAVFTSLVNQLFTAIILRTPKDTGHAQSGWQLKKVSDKPDNLQFRILNIVGYIVFLEFGWSRQAPKGMVRVSLEEMRRNLAKAVREWAA